MYLPESGLYLDGVPSGKYDYRNWIIFPGTLIGNGLLSFASMPLPTDSIECIHNKLYYSGCSPDSIRTTHATLIKKLDKIPTLKELQTEFPELFI